MARAVGIDLGTTNSVIAVMEADGNVKVIPNAEGFKFDAQRRRLHEGRATLGGHPCQASSAAEP
jgi:molecular chaperone DnaK (HSP70)